MDFQIGGIALLVLVPGIVETAKKFGVVGNWSLALSLALGFVFVGLAQAIQTNLIPAVAIPWITVVVVGLGGSLAASGYYDLAKRFSAR
jgi:hypothetical protein